MKKDHQTRTANSLRSTIPVRFGNSIAHVDPSKSFGAKTSHHMDHGGKKVRSLKSAVLGDQIQVLGAKTIDGATYVKKFDGVAFAIDLARAAGCEVKTPDSFTDFDSIPSTLSTTA